LHSHPSKKCSRHSFPAFLLHDSSSHQRAPCSHGVFSPHMAVGPCVFLCSSALPWLPTISAQHPAPCSLFDIGVFLPPMAPPSAVHAEQPAGSSGPPLLPEAGEQVFFLPPSKLHSWPAPLPGSTLASARFLFMSPMEHLGVLAQIPAGIELTKTVERLQQPWRPSS
jgi:hypothetical protein